jgi:hypothetical protein
MFSAIISHEKFPKGKTNSEVSEICSINLKIWKNREKRDLSKIIKKLDNVIQLTIEKTVFTNT